MNETNASSRRRFLQAATLASTAYLLAPSALRSAEKESKRKKKRPEQENTAGSPRAKKWPIDSLREIGGLAPQILGQPQAVTEDGRKALRFNGKSDGVILPENPLHGIKAFTVEVLFKPDGDGPQAQRFVHLQDVRENRALIETRITPDRKWYLDTFLFAAPREPGLTLIDPTKLHPCDRWYWAALSYDGKTMAHYVNAVREREGTIDFGPMVEGRISLGVRLNQVFWFKGTIAEVRFEPLALTAPQLQRV